MFLSRPSSRARPLPRPFSLGPIWATKRGHTNAYRTPQTVFVVHEEKKLNEIRNKSDETPNLSIMNIQDTKTFMGQTNLRYFFSHAIFHLYILLQDLLVCAFFVQLNNLMDIVFGVSTTDT